MNSENFHEYLKNPSLLYQANYQELKSLVVQYPYSSNLRLLLLLKSLIDNHRDFDRNLVTASMFGIDRARLFEQVNLFEKTLYSSENVVITEEYLELKDLSIIEDIPQKEPSAQPPLEHALDIEEMLIPEEPTHTSIELEDLEDEAAFLEDIPNVHIEPKHRAPAPPPLMSLEDLMEDDLSIDEEEEMNDEEEEADESSDSQEQLEVNEFFGEDDDAENDQDDIDKIVDEAVEIARTKLGEKVLLLKVVDDAATIESITQLLFEDKGNAEDSLDINTPPPSQEAPSTTIQDENPADLHPTPTTKFSSWLQQLQPPQVSKAPIDIRSDSDEEENLESHEDDADKKLLDDAKQLAAQSVAEDFDIASETLAAVLEAQGHTQKAIAMYERLMLKYPEKSTFFAAKIDELKSK